MSQCAISRFFFYVTPHNKGHFMGVLLWKFAHEIESLEVSMWHTYMTHTVSRPSKLEVKWTTRKLCNMYTFFASENTHGGIKNVARSWAILIENLPNSNYFIFTNKSFSAFVLLLKGHSKFCPIKNVFFQSY